MTKIDVGHAHSSKDIAEGHSYRKKPIAEKTILEPL